MRVQSPVGEFPVTLAGVSVEKGTPSLDLSMGVWRSRVSLERRDYPLLGLLLTAAVCIFLAGRRSSH
jgi:hypothetical protein